MSELAKGFLIAETELLITRGQLAAERAKVAELKNEVHEREESDKADVVLRPIVTEEREAEIRREVAREILGLADGSGYISAKLIRREFGVTE